MDCLAHPERLLGLSLQALAACAGGEPLPIRRFAGAEAYIDLRQRGLALVLELDVVVAVQLFRARHKGFREFGHPLPNGLRFDMSRSQAQALLGEPQCSSSGVVVDGLGPMPGWDLFRRADSYLHLEYTPNLLGIRLVSITAL